MSSTADMSWDDIKALFRETDRKFQETDREFRETRELSDRLAKETARDLKKLGEKLDGLGDKFVYFTEGMALPSMERLLRKRFGMTNVSPRHRVHDGEREQEYDILAWAKGAVNRAVVVEVESQVKKDSIEQLIKQIEALPELVPELTGKERLGILAGVDWDAGVMKEAQSQGLHTARIHDEVFELTRSKAFQPRVWR